MEVMNCAWVVNGLGWIVVPCLCVMVGPGGLQVLVCGCQKWVVLRGVCE